MFGDFYVANATYCGGLCQVIGFPMFLPTTSLTLANKWARKLLRDRGWVMLDNRDDRIDFAFKDGSLGVITLAPGSFVDWTEEDEVP